MSISFIKCFEILYIKGLDSCDINFVILNIIILVIFFGILILNSLER